MAAIVDSSDDAIVSKNLRSTIMSWNAGAERIFGYTAAEAVGKQIDILFPPDRLEEEKLILSRIQAGERVEHFETVRVRKDGTMIDVSLTISPIRDAEGTIVGASKIARDITEQKLAQRKFIEAHEALKKADKLKSDFIATLSHELRTPLNAILGWVALIEDGAADEDCKEGMQVIGRNARLQARLIDDLLDVSRLDAGKVRIEMRVVDLAEAVAGAMETVTPAAQAKRVELKTALNDESRMVLGDLDRLHQIVWNLLTNAVKFTPAGGRVTATISREGSGVELAVSDTGQGIEPEFLPMVFERFQQADSSSSRRHGGLGIGLTITKQLTELHGGTIRVESEGLGKGATVTVRFPLSPIADANGGQQGRQDLKGIKVLVIDDEGDTLRILDRTLSRRDAEVVTAGSVVEGLQRFREFQPDVILCDIGMPEQDGFQFIRQLRSLSCGRYVPVVALTAFVTVQDRINTLNAGFQGHLGKPVDSTELISAVQHLGRMARLHGR